MDQKIKTIKGIYVNYSMEDPSKPAETEWIEANSYTASLNEYDKNGNLIKSSSYTHGEEVHEFYEYTYDADNNLTEELCYMDENELAEHKFITWNEQKLPAVEKVVYQEDGSENTTYFAYNENKLLTKKKVVDQDDELEEYDTYEYENDRLICEKKFDSDKNLVFTKKYNYDEDGNMTAYEYSSTDEYDYQRSEYYYNENGERVKTLRYNYKDQLIEKNIVQFDDKGNITELIEENQRSNKITRLYYDDNNNQIKQEEFNEDEILITSIERTFTTDNKLMESLVYTQNPEDGVQQMYAYKYEYEFWSA
jgi:hypothetical protein